MKVSFQRVELKRVIAENEQNARRREAVELQEDCYYHPRGLTAPAGVLVG